MYFRTRHTLASSFLFPIIIYHCKVCYLTMYQEKENYTPKEARKGPHFKVEKTTLFPRYTVELHSDPSER